MTKTFADMAPEERAEHNGMWCDLTNSDGSTVTVIYAGEYDNNPKVHRLMNNDGLGVLIKLGRLTPRYDLSRAWNADGTAVVKSTALAQLTTLKDFKNAPEGTIVEITLEDAFQKVSPNDWESCDDVYTDEEMVKTGPWDVLRLGWGLNNE